VNSLRELTRFHHIILVPNKLSGKQHNLHESWMIQVYLTALSWPYNVIYIVLLVYAEYYSRKERIHCKGPVHYTRLGHLFWRRSSLCKGGILHSDNPIHDSELTLSMCVFLNNTPHEFNCSPDF
jgi:hypothetical protein